MIRPLLISVLGGGDPHPITWWSSADKKTIKRGRRPRSLWRWRRRKACSKTRRGLRSGAAAGAEYRFLVWLAICSPHGGS